MDPESNAVRGADNHVRVFVVEDVVEFFRLVMGAGVLATHSGMRIALISDKEGLMRSCCSKYECRRYWEEG